MYEFALSTEPKIIRIALGNLRYFDNMMDERVYEYHFTFTANNTDNNKHLKNTDNNLLV